MSVTAMVEVKQDDWVQIATEQEDFIAQNPQPNNMLYMCNAPTKPVIDSADPAFVAGKRVPPYQYYGREDAANNALQQGIVWARADKDMFIPVDK